MKMKILIGLMLSLLLLPVVFSVCNKDDICTLDEISDEDCTDCAGCRISNMIDKITSLVLVIGGGLAILALTFVGIMMFNTSDPAEKDNLKERMKYILIGIIIIVVAPIVVKYIMGSAFTACPTP